MFRPRLDRGGVPDHEPGRDADRRSRRASLELGDEQLRRRAALLRQALVDGGQSRPVQGVLVVVEPGDQHVVGYLQPGLGQGGDAAVRGRVVAGHHGVEVATPAQQGPQRPVGDVGDEPPLDDELLVDRDATGRQLLAEHGLPFRGVLLEGPSPDQHRPSDPALVEQVTHQGPHPGDVVPPHAAQVVGVGSDDHRGQGEFRRQLDQLLEVLLVTELGREQPDGSGSAEELDKVRGEGLRLLTVEVHEPRQVVRVQHRSHPAQEAGLVLLDAGRGQDDEARDILDHASRFRRPPTGGEVQLASHHFGRSGGILDLVG